MEGQINQPQPDNPDGKKPTESGVAGLFLAFVPSLLLIALKNTRGGSGLWVAFGISIVCCFASAFLLVRHKVWWAILLAILFFFINGAISFLFGCAAVIGPL